MPFTHSQSVNSAGISSEEKKKWNLSIYFEFETFQEPATHLMKLKRAVYIAISEFNIFEFWNLQKGQDREFRSFSKDDVTI